MGSIISSEFQCLCGVLQILPMPMWVSGFLLLPRNMAVDVNEQLSCDRLASHVEYLFPRVFQAMLCVHHDPD